VNLPDPAGGDRELVLADGRPIRYQGRVDLLAGDEHDRYWVVAHRLVDRFGAADDLLLDEELVAACWAMERFYPGMRIAGTVHNELRIDSTGDPTGRPPPQRRRKRLGVGLRPTARRLRPADSPVGHARGIPQHEASGGGRSLPYARRGAARARPPDPVPVLSEGDGEFRRTRIPRDRAELEAMGARLAAEALDMVDPGLRVYPNPAPEHCGGCGLVAPAWPSSAARTSGPCSGPPTATGARSGSSRAGWASPPGAPAAARPRPGSTAAERPAARWNGHDTICGSRRSGEEEQVAQPDDTAAGRPSRRRLLVRALVAVAVVAAVFFGLLPRLVDVEQVWATLRAMTWLELVTLLAAALWNLGSYLLPQLAATPGLSLRQAVLESHASTAVGNLLPAGQAVGLGVTYRFYTSYGLDRGPIALSLLVQGVWNNFVKLGMPIVALGLLVASGDTSGDLAPAAVVGLVVFVLALAGFAFGLSGERRAARLGGALANGVAWLRRLVRRPGRPDWDRSAVAFRAQAVTLLRDRWHWLTLTTLASHLSLFLVLLLALRHVGVSEDEVSWVEALAAFALVRLLSAFPLTPGGLGVVELGLAAALVLAGGDEAQVVAAVLVFRLLTFLLPIPIGALTWWLWRRGTWYPSERPVVTGEERGWVGRQS
jgi:putative heme transporter